MGSNPERSAIVIQLKTFLQRTFLSSSSMQKFMDIFIACGIDLKLLYTVSLPSIGEKEPHVLSGHKDWVSCCSVSPDCSMIASVGRFDRVSCPSTEDSPREPQ